MRNFFGHRVDNIDDDGANAAFSPRNRPAAAPQPRSQIPSRRVMAELVPPTNVRVSLTGGLGVRITRTDQPEATAERRTADRTTGWTSTAPEQAVVGHGTTELLRRQLDQLDALAPGALVQFAVHPLHRSAVSPRERLPPLPNPLRPLAPAPVAVASAAGQDRGAQQQPVPNRHERPRLIVTFHTRVGPVTGRVICWATRDEN
ncbi:uncharacterized protein THITE_2086218 [Thermothielavioides terrestris NRRL 8126]|uniref:Uncharacterized protein n=1 Tax=Thermothielavioides terrestris (strain ATCC 38088 / NRRL 8126) TaxID=578455 RepID=G2QVZ2_THETT|nr:uncharacterized protein THITE_2086218 [Thermothielavioides terrestris NRRL 8126]AEO64724.1 hypothetical protein THITE_2086218 [Thermothielavioides terrestris NRRL 8126]